jgi:acyl-CoA thioesterase I
VRLQLGTASQRQVKCRRGTKVIMVENGNFRGLPHQADGVHLTPEGYRAIAQRLLPQVTGAIGR